MLSLLSTGLRVKAVIAATAAIAATSIIVRGGPAAIDLSAEASSAVDGTGLTTNHTSLQWAGVPGQAVLDTPADHDIGPLQGDLPATVPPIIPADRWNGPAATMLFALQASGLLPANAPLPPPQPASFLDVTIPSSPAPQDVVEVASAFTQIAVVTPVDAKVSDAASLPAVNSYPLSARASGS